MQLDIAKYFPILKKKDSERIKKKIKKRKKMVLGSP